MAKITYVPPVTPIACMTQAQRRHLLDCLHRQLADAHSSLAAALRQIDGVRNFAARNGMHDHAEQIFETHTRAGFQAYLLDVYLDALRAAVETGDAASPPSHPGLKRKRGLQ
jgi:hypothetical protein